jgi:hypothetical protein
MAFSGTPGGGVPKGNSIDVSPSLSVYDVVEVHVADFVSSFEYLWGDPSRVFGSHGPNVLLSPFCLVMGFSSHQCTVSCFVGVVVFARVPSKVIQIVVGRVSVVVARFHPCWTRTDEGTQNQMVDVVAFLVGKNDTPIPAIANPQRNQRSPCRFGF